MSIPVILCMKWGDKYGAEYVNRLYRMVHRHLHRPFRFICLTDREYGIVPEIECRPIPALDIPAGLPERGWKKLAVFSSELDDLRGSTVLFLDLDVVILRDIGCFFHQPDKRPDEIRIIRDWKKPWRKVGNSSVFRFHAGQFSAMYRYFCEHFADIRQRFRHEQAYLSWYVRQHHLLTYWPEDWCLSYKYQVLKKLPFSLWQPPAVPEVGKILIFHGEVNPPDAIQGGGGKWYRKVLPAPWLADFWK